MLSREDATRKLRSGSRQPRLRIEALCTRFTLRQGLLRRASGEVRALDGVELRVMRGQTLALVGEPGAGKSVLALSILRRVPAVSGKVFLDGKDLLSLGEADARASLEQIRLVTADDLASGDRLSRLRELAAREPKLIIFDEAFGLSPTPARAELVAELGRLQEEHGLTCLVLTRDLALAGSVADDVIALHAGQVVETGAAPGVAQRPHHPYTRALATGQLVPLVSAPFENALGCGFRARCPQAFERCSSESPALLAVVGGFSRCFLEDSADPER